MYSCMCIYIYIYIHTHIHIHMYISIPVSVDARSSPEALMQIPCILSDNAGFDSQESRPPGAPGASADPSPRLPRPISVLVLRFWNSGGLTQRV